jgi:S-adenosylmethionine hydrolase
VIYADHFGNLVTSIDRASLDRLAASFHGLKLLVRIGNGAPIRLVHTYGDAARGASLATVGSFELLEIAVRDGNAAQRFRARIGARVSVTVGR